MATNTRGKATAILIVAEILFILLFGLFVDYADVAGPRTGNETHGHNLENYYPMFQDIHVMMLVGFGFLMTFLAYHGFGSVGFNFLLTCYIIQWATLINGWFKMIGPEGHNNIRLDIMSFMEADFAVATVLISFGAVLGKTSPVQLIVMATLEVVFYNISLYIGVTLLGAVDIGGAIFIHLFGAYFGLAASRLLYKKAQTESAKETSIYHSDIFAMIGTVFLWLYWPSFNAGPAVENERHRAVINTILSLTACTVHIQNATLAGGVVMGASADLILHPFGAMLGGTVAAIVSTLGYKYLQPVLTDKFKIHDTCGVNNLHGMPGIIGAILSAIACAVATRETYKGSYEVFFSTRTPQEQGGYQIAAMTASLALAIVSGALTGLLLKCLPDILDAPEKSYYYDDSLYWDAVEEQPTSSNSPQTSTKAIAKDVEALETTRN